MSMKYLSEETFENNVIDELAQMQWDTHYSFDRPIFNITIDYDLLKHKIMEFNNVSEEIAEKAIFEIKKISGPAIQQNIEGMKFLVNGVKIYDSNNKKWMTLKIVSDKQSENHFGVIRQFELFNSNDEHRIPDIVCFLNGLPIIVIELKAPDANERLEDAFKQNDSLKRQFPQLYAFNIFDLVSNNLETKYGSITAPFKRYFNVGKWNEETNPLRNVLTQEKILDFIYFFSFFNDENTIKYVAGLHQIEAVNRTIHKIKNNDHKGGVVWHTQGSGKSITMLFLSKKIIKHHPKSTILVITDRNTLNKQLFGVFSSAINFLRNKPVEAQSRQDLINKLENKKHFGLYFSTVQKFSENTGVLTRRSDVFILVDEAHRTQNNIDGIKNINKETKEYITKFGFAKFMRIAFPNAVLTGFTGTPLLGDKTTTDIFGGYNHKYSMNDSVADGSTVPIYYEARKVKIHLNEKYLQIMDRVQRMYALTLKQNDVQSEQKMQTLLKSAQAKSILENPNVINIKTQDILKHLKSRENVLHGKAMIVASSRKAAFEYYKAIKKISPSLINEVILVMTHNNKDSKQEEEMIVHKSKINEVANEFRRDNSKYRIAIVVDMWLTGFDVPDLDVMYIDKIIKWHNLMQAIARVNRTYQDETKTKESGLIVDYLGIWKYLSDALTQYAGGHGEDVDIIPKDLEKAKIKLIDEIDVINDHFVKNIKSFPNLDKKMQYNFIMNNTDIILGYTQEDRNAFILKVRAMTRLLKIAFTIIDRDTASMVRCLQVINNLLTIHNTQEDINLKITIEQIKEAIKKSVHSNETDITIKSTKIGKDINQVAKILEEEAKQLRHNNPHLAKKLLIDAINGKIAEVKKFRPIFAKKISEKLKNILFKLEKEEKLQKVIDMLIAISKEVTNKLNDDPEFNDPYLQAFFSILADDEYLKHNKNSEVLKSIANDLMNTIKENITDQFYKNKKVKNIVTAKLKFILKTKYNYPPEQLGGISKILIDQINKEIVYNPKYFIKKKEVV